LDTDRQTDRQTDRRRDGTAEKVTDGLAVISHGLTDTGTAEKVTDEPTVISYGLTDTGAVEKVTDEPTVIRRTACTKGVFAWQNLAKALRSLTLDFTTLWPLSTNF